ncbi:hypothetical protein, unlikely [Trypanosoma congolense IL3000]|uniref:Uncharacterized protein n=1 Tax=Trypanosoma congolense (strain IL3000) TaxID=1068625 RepID=F9WJY4_TRYCI|nr:hypothetical protein, unlikely [Trypanosoma congolense IL3000]CCD17644.1 hypothetical protein, unlikely [Trypanosoma congolense IL3000]
MPFSITPTMLICQLALRLLTLRDRPLHVCFRTLHPYADIFMPIIPVLSSTSTHALCSSCRADVCSSSTLLSSFHLAVSGDGAWNSAPRLSSLYFQSPCGRAVSMTTKVQHLPHISTIPDDAPV